MAQERTMGMFLQDPAFPNLSENHKFNLSSDFLCGTASARFEVRDEDLDGVQLYPTWRWEDVGLDLSLDGFRRLANERPGMSTRRPRNGVNPKGKPNPKEEMSPEDWRSLTGIPQFHQVNVFAVADHAIGLVEGELGRPIRWQTGRPLILRPHAFEDANAYFDPEEGAINFGFFRSSFRSGIVWTCLSHDIIVHELGHAILTSLCPLFDWSPQPDVAAFHESFSDLTAIFAALASISVVEACLQNGKSLEQPNLIAGLGEQYGAAIYGLGDPYLRSALNTTQYDCAQTSPHEQSQALTSALYETLCGMAGKRPPASASKAEVGEYMKKVADEVRHLRGMFLRVLNYLPPTGLTLPQFAQIFLVADELAFPTASDNGFRKLARNAFADHALLPKGGKLPFSFKPPPGLKAEDIKKAATAGRFGLMTFVNNHREDFELPGEAVLLDAWANEADRGFDSKDKEARKERYVHYTYEVTLAGSPTMLSGTLVLEEIWTPRLWVTDPARPEALVSQQLRKPLEVAIGEYETRIIETYNQERYARALALADYLDALLADEEAEGGFAARKMPIHRGGDTPIHHGGKTPIRRGGDTPIHHAGDTPIHHGGKTPIRRGRDTPIHHGGRGGSRVRQVFGIRRR